MALGIVSLHTEQARFGTWDWSIGGEILNFIRLLFDSILESPGD